MDSTGDTPRTLQLKRQELAVEQQALADTQSLLNRVEEQQRANPDDEARWTKRTQYLQDAIKGSRERVESLTAAIRTLETKFPNTPAAPPPAPDMPSPAPRAPDALLAEQRRAAAERVMAAPVIKLEALALEDFALARAFVNSPEARAWPLARREELRRRVSIYDRRAERERMQSRPRVSIEERRQQMLLRNVIDKCRAQSYSALTIGEIDLLIHSCDLLVQNRASYEQGDRLFDLLNRTVDEVCQRWTKLGTLRDALKPES